MIEQLVGRPCRGHAGFFIEVENGIDDGTVPGLRIRDDILDTEGALVEEALHDRMTLQR